MSRTRRQDPDRAFADYMRRHRQRERPPLDLRKGLPDEWKARRRRAAAGPPPDFDTSDEQVKRHAERRFGMWAPEIVDIKRLAQGWCGYLVRGRTGGAVMVIVDREGTVRRTGSEQEFRTLSEVL